MISALTRHIGRNLIAYVALFVALSGSAFAAAEALGPNTVGTSQLKNNAVTSPKVKDSTLTSADVKNGTLLKADFKPGQLTAGPPGAPGATGPTGPAGAPAAKYWAVVNTGGSLVRGSGVTDSDKAGTGAYIVKFSGSIANCAWTATPNATNNGYYSGQASANKDTSNDAWLRVGVFSAAGAFADPAQVSVAVFC